MRTVRAWLRRAADALRRDRRDRDFHDELEAHLQMHIDDNRRAGLDEAESRRLALLKLGGLEQTRERFRDRSGLPSIDAIVKDFRFALRLMRRNAGFTATVLATLAIGIGANSVMFSVVNTVLLRPLPYFDPDRLVLIRTVDAVRRTASYTSPPDFYAYRAQNRSLEHLDAFYTQQVNVTGGREPERLQALAVSSDFFSTLGTALASGRGFVPQDEGWGSHRVVILSNGLWQRRFGADPSILGGHITLNGEPHVIVGILPAGFSFVVSDAQLFLAMSFAPGDSMNSHSNNFLRMVGRLKPATTIEQAATDLNRLSDAIIAEQKVNQGSALDLVPLQEAIVGNVRRPVLVLLGAVGFVLIITCANLANLLLARAAGRQREIAVRLAIGATRGRLVRQFLIESLMLSFGGGAAGLAIAFVSAGTLNSISPQVLPRAAPIHVDAVVLAFTFAIATLTGILLGLAPAGQTGSGSVALQRRLGPSHKSRPAHRASLVVAEVALSLVLLVGAGLMIKSMYQLLHVDAGFQPANVLTMNINLVPQKYVDPSLERRQSPDAYNRAVAFFDDAIARVRTLESKPVVGAINGLPLLGEVWGKRVTFWDRPLPADVRGLPSIQYRVVAGDYFRALGIRMLSGRAFTDADNAQAPKVAIVNRELVRRDWNGKDPIGKIISVNPPLQVLPKSVIDEARRAGTLRDDYEPDRFTVVGVADDVRYGGLANAPLPLVYVPYGQGSEGTTAMFLVVRTAGDPLAIAAAVREQITAIDRDQPIANIQTMDARVAASVARPRLQMIVLGVFALVAIAVALVGIYGAMSYAVTQQAREIGIRLALGAAPCDVLALILRQGAAMIAIGLTLGVTATLLLARLIRTLLFDVSPSDPSVIAAIVFLVAATGIAATYVPAIRASRVDPLVTLRSE